MLVTQNQSLPATASRNAMAPAIRHRKNHSVEFYAARIERVREAVDLLSQHDIEVLDIDINRSSPIIRVPVSANLRQLGKSVSIGSRPSSRGRVRINLILIEAIGCRIVFETCGH